MCRCRASVVLLCVVSLLLSAIAQQSPELESGLKPFGTFQGGNIDSVSLSSGNVMVHIPLISYPQRGGMLRVNFFLRFNSKNWYPKFIDNASGGLLRWTWGAKGEEHGIGLALDQPLALKTAIHNDPTDPNDPTVNILHAITPDGASHGMEATECSANCTFDIPLAYESIDATAIKATGVPEIGGSGATLIDRSGVRHTMGTSQASGLWRAVKMEDPNGNFITISYPQLNPLVTDALGRTIGTVTTASTASCPAGTTSAKNVDFPGFEGGNADLIFCYTNISPSSNFGFSGIQDWTYAATPFLTAVILPAQPATKWQFSYLASGEISSITLPTGGTIAYEWEVRPGGQFVSRWIKKRKVNANDGTEKKSGLTVGAQLPAQPAIP